MRLWRWKWLAGAVVSASAMLVPVSVLPAAAAPHPAGGPVSTATTLIGSPDPSTLGQPVTFTATVTPIGPGSGIPTGSVTFVNVTTSTGFGTVGLDAAGQATLVTTALAVGVSTITATYNPDPPFLTSSGLDLHIVVPVPTTTTLLSSLNPSNVGDPVTFTAQVSPIGPLSVVPTGSVTFLDGATTLGAVGLDGSGRASLTTSALPAGARVITATYIPSSAGFIGSSGTLTKQVDEAVSTTTTSTTTTTTTEPATTTTPPTSVVITDPPESTDPPRTTVPTQPPSTPTAAVSHAVIAPGREQVGFGSGFQPGETVIGEQHSTPLGLGTQTAGADGTVSFTWTVRADETPGEHTFVVTGSVSGTASATFRVVPADTLPATGTDGDGIAIMAAAVVVVGGLLVLQARRRPTPS